MNVRRRVAATGPVGCCPKNANTQMKSSTSQVAPIKNNVSTPKKAGYGKVRNAVNG